MKMELPRSLTLFYKVITLVSSPAWACCAEYPEEAMT